MSTRIANRDASAYVERLEEFEGSNIFSEHNGSFYTVYSYGHHFPMYIYHKGRGIWYENSSKYSVSTSKQQGQCYPNTKTQSLSTEDMKKVLNGKL